MDGGGVDDRCCRDGDHHHWLPWTRAAFNIAVYMLVPFGQKAVSRATYGQHDLGTGPFGMTKGKFGFYRGGGEDEPAEVAKR